MENRREYFDRSKHVLNKVKKLIFVSEIQSKQWWLAWSKEENIRLKDEPALVPLSVSDELAIVAGISCSLNTPTFTTEMMMAQRRSLRSAVRREMGLTDDDMLAVSLSSINPGKGQLLLKESSRLLIEHGQQLNNSGPRYSILIHHDYYSRALLQNQKRDVESSSGPLSDKPYSNIGSHAKKRIKSSHVFANMDRLDSLKFDLDGSMRKMISEIDGKKKQKLKILLGSVGSESNKVPFVRTLLTFLSTHSNLSKSVLWTPATTRVAPLYSAADVYIMNSQGMGETFGRVTIEAMAFGLPV